LCEKQSGVIAVIFGMVEIKGNKIIVTSLRTIQQGVVTINPLSLLLI
jgi:hypothetical protein